MPTVPIDSRRPSADMPVPSETDLMMALATMKELGRVPSFKDRLDPTLQGKVEDRRGEGPSGALDEDLPGIAASARDVATDRLAAGVKHAGSNDRVLKEFYGMKRRRSTIEYPNEDSIGVSGGSR